MIHSSQRKSDTYARRSSVEINYRILKYIYEAPCALKTHILYASGLNSKNLESHLNILLKSKIIEVDNDRCYKLTQKGYELLQILEDYFEILNSEHDADRVLKEVEASVNRDLQNGENNSIEIIVSDDRNVERALKKVIANYLLYITDRKDVYVLIPLKAYEILMDFTKYTDFLLNNVIPYEHYNARELAECLKELQQRFARQ